MSNSNFNANFEYAFESRRLISPFRFGATKLNNTELSNIESFFLREVGKKDIAESPFFPGRSPISKQNFKNELLEGKLSEAAYQLMSYCKYQLNFLQNYALNDFSPIGVNAVISELEADVIYSKITAAIRKNFQAVKIKFMPSNYRAVIDVIDALGTPLLSKMAIRLDSNSSFQPDEVIDISMRLQEYPIEFWEDPVPFTDHYNYQYMTKESPFPIALDEHIKSIKQALELLHTKCCHIAVIKPAQMRDLPLLEKSLLQSPELKNKIVLSSLFEGVFGSHFLQKFAGKLKLQAFPHGLNTLSYFEEDLHLNSVLLRPISIPQKSIASIENLKWLPI